MEKYNGSLIRQFPSLITGNAASGVNVSVCEVNTSNLVTIYGVDDTNSTPIANPITTDSKGFYSFYVPDGRYTLRFSNGFPALEINMIDAVAWATIIQGVGGILYEAQTKKDGPFTVGSLTGGVIPLTNINYTPGTGLQIWVMADGDKLTYLDDYTESGPQSVTLTASALATLDPLTEIEVWTNSIVPYSNPPAGSSADTKTYSSFAAMVAGDNSQFEKVETKHYYADWTAAAATPKGASSYVRTTETGTPGDTDGGSYFVATDGFKFVLDYDDRVFISQFGAKVANDTFDNRAAIQACLDFCTTSGANFVVDPVEQTWDPSLNGGSGGYINRYFGVGSFHPAYVDGYCLFVGEPRNFFIFGNTSRVSSIRYYGSTPGKCVLKLGAIHGSDWGYVIDGLGLSCTADEPDQAGCVLDHAIYARNDDTLARCTVRNSTFSGGLLIPAEFHGYMMDFQQVECKYGQQGGLKYDGPDNLPTGSDPVTTSITLQNVWARFCGGTGIYMRNQAWYINMISCGVDGAGPAVATALNRPEYAYQFGNVRGFSMMACGCEEVDRVMKMVSADSVNIVGMKGTGWGKVDGTVADYAIEITGNGSNVNISGWPKGTAVTTGSAPTKKFNYVLGITKSDGALGNLLVQIMDNGINYLEVFHVASTGTYTIPVSWPNDTADGAHRAQRKTGNVTWPVAGVSVAPTAGQYGQAGVVRKITAIGGESTFATHNLLTHFGGNVATTITVKAIINSQSGTTAAVWEGVANVTIGSGKSVPYFTQVAGNSGATPTLAWSGDTLQYSAGANFFDSIIEINAYSETTSVSVRFDV